METIYLIEDLKKELNDLVSIRLIRQDEICNFGMQEQFHDSRPTKEKLLLDEKLIALQKAVITIGTIIINNVRTMD